MFKVNLSKVIWGDQSCKTLVAHLYREIELPFPPYIGMEIFSGRWTSGPIERVRWDVNEERFLAEVKTAVPYKTLEYDFTAQWFLDHDTRDGWSKYDDAGETK